MQFPTMVEDPAFAPPALGGGSSTIAVPSNSPLSGTPYDPYASPLAQAPLATGQPSFPAPQPYTAPTYSPYAPSPYAPAPYAPAPSALYPEGIQMPQPNFSFGQTLKFMQDIRLRWTWLAPIGERFIGVNDVETNVTFAVPFFKTTSPLMVTPGFAIHFWEGPITEAPYNADLPARTYDAYLDGAWYPQVTNWLSAQVGVRVGAYTDFNTFNTNSIRIMGRGLGVVTLTPTLQFAAGVVYIDRVLIKILPAGGLIWTPNPDARYEFLFPNPRGTRRWTTLGNTDIWLYITGEYGGGSWTGQRLGGLSDQFDYNDLRVSGGIESFSLRGFHAFFEVGYAWDRKIVYRFGPPDYPASDTVMLRAGATY
ncbi:MAG: hypothetical protein WD063_05170 [Pirellulales bacterium]